MTGKDLHAAYIQAQTEMPKRGQTLQSWEGIGPDGQTAYNSIAEKFAELAPDDQTGAMLYLTTNTHHGAASSAYRIAFKDIPEVQKALWNRIAELLTAAPVSTDK